MLSREVDFVLGLVPVSLPVWTVFGAENPEFKKQTNRNQTQLLPSVRSHRPAATALGVFRVLNEGGGPTAHRRGPVSCVPGPAPGAPRQQTPSTEARGRGPSAVQVQGLHRQPAGFSPCGPHAPCSPVCRRSVLVPFLSEEALSIAGRPSGRPPRRPTPWHLAARPLPCVLSKDRVPLCPENKSRGGGAGPELGNEPAVSRHSRPLKKPEKLWMREVEIQRGPNTHTHGKKGKNCTKMVILL